MKIAAIYSFNNGKNVVEEKYGDLFDQIKEAIDGVNAARHKTKVSEEKTMKGKLLYDPKLLNKAFKREFGNRDWKSQRVQCEYPKNLYIDGYQPPRITRGAFREMDFIKGKLGIEVQFGKYSFMVYNVAAKMTIFRNLGFIDTGVEIVPIKEFADEMSSGVSYFEQFVWDLEKRGVSNIDIPVLILGIDR
jgi:hypothetical protein